MIQAAFTDGIALICVIPSKSKNGVYLVKVEPREDCIAVTHQCPAYRFHNDCSHVMKAVTCFYTWRWWEEPKPIVTIWEHITLNPEWDQIPVPGSTQDAIRLVIEGDPYAT